MKLIVYKNHLGGQIWYRSLYPIKKTASLFFLTYIKEVYETVEQATKDFKRVRTCFWLFIIFLITGSIVAVARPTTEHEIWAQTEEIYLNFVLEKKS